MNIWFVRSLWFNVWCKICSLSFVYMCFLDLFIIDVNNIYHTRPQHLPCWAQRWRMRSCGCFFVFWTCITVRWKSSNGIYWSSLLAQNSTVMLGFKPTTNAKFRQWLVDSNFSRYTICVKKNTQVYSFFTLMEINYLISNLVKGLFIHVTTHVDENNELVL